MKRSRVILVMMCLLTITLSGCSTNYTVSKVPDRYLDPTPYPENVPTTFGQCVKEAIPDWKAALDSANADKAAARKYQEEMN